VSEETAQTSDGSEEGHEDPGFEAAVKGVGQGIAGRLKEMVGELIEDPNLEEEGIVQQLDGKLRRAGAAPEPPESPSPSA